MDSFKNRIAQKIFSLLMTKNYTKPNTNLSYPTSASIYGNHFEGNITIGENSKVLRTECYGHVNIGSNTALNGPNLNIYSGDGKVTIGNFCSIARNVSIQLDSHNYKKITSYQIFKNLFQSENKSEIINNGDIEIGNDVWIGANAMIYGNVTIGNGAVIGSNSFVNKDVPAYAIVVGSPAKIIKYRFGDAIIERLKALQWWDWDEQTLRKNQSLFESELTLEILDKIQS